MAPESEHSKQLTGLNLAVREQVQTPVALVDKNVDRRSSKMRGPTRAAAEAFLHYLFQPEAQAEFAENGFRCTLLRVFRTRILPLQIASLVAHAYRTVMRPQPHELHMPFGHSKIAQGD